jgi:hypothetical protein
LRASPDQSLRRQILADLGIEVWRLRTGRPSAALEAPPEAAPEVPGPRRERMDAGAAARPRGPAGGLPVGPEQRGSDRAGAEHAGADRAAASASGARSRAAAPAEALSVLSYSAGGMTLLLGQRPAGRDARLVRDLFAAVCGRWDVDPVSRVFDWPPAVAIPGADGEGAVDRALRAFVEKELADHQSTLVLVEQALAGRLLTLRFAGERVAIPDLARLGRDSQEKRRLWAVLGRRVCSTPRVPEQTAGSAPRPEVGRGADDPA